MADQVSTAVSGVTARGYQRGAGSGAWDQYVIPVSDELTSFRGRANSFRTLGIAGQQTIFAINNAAGSAVLVRVNRLTLDCLNGAIRAIATIPPVVRVYRLTAGVATAGTALGKASLDTQYTSSASVSCLGATASDGGAATAITATLTMANCLAQKFAPRVVQLTAAGQFYEPIDTMPFLHGEPDCILRAGQGVAVTVEAGGAATDHWTVDSDWTEYTRP